MGHDHRCSRLKSSVPFKRDLALQNIHLSKQPFKMQPQIENEDVTWSPQYNLPTTRTNECRALSLQEVELDGWFLNSSHCNGHVYLCNSCTTLIRMSFVVRFYNILGSTSWIRTDPSIKALKCKNPSKWNSYEGFNLEHCARPCGRVGHQWSGRTGS